MNSTKFLHRYLPIFLSVFLIVAGYIFFSTLSSNTQVADAAWYASGGTWTNRKQIVVDHTKVASTTTVSNFPMLFSVTDSDLKTVTNGGKVGTDTGIDILFTSSDGTTKLSHEIEKYASTTGETVAWVKTDLSPSVDTVLYIYFGNAAASDQQDTADGVNDVWDTNYKVVAHYDDGTTLSATDSTSNANNGTITGATARTGKIDGSANYDGSNDRVEFGSAANIDNFTERTISFWATFDTPGSQDAVINKGTGATSTTGGWQVQKVSTGAISYLQAFGTSPGQWNTSEPVWDTNRKSYVVITYDSSSASNDPLIYIDGELATVTEIITPSGTAATDGTFNLRTGENNSGSLDLDGMVDEIRYSSNMRPATWIKTEYNNQVSPSSFYAYSGLGVENRTAAGVKAASQANTGPGWYNTGGTWTNRKQIVINRTKVASSTTISNFPFLFNVTDTDLKYTSFGGKVGKTDGTDILFTSSDGTTKLSHEIEKYASSTGETVAWVKTDLSPTTDTVLYIYFGNAAASDQQSVNAVWDSNFKAVWHLSQNPGGTAPQMTDSTSNAKHITASSTMTSSNLVAGKIDGALNFNGTNNMASSSVALDSSVYGTNARTVSFWFNTGTFDTGTARILMIVDGSAGVGSGTGVQISAEDNSVSIAYNLHRIIVGKNTIPNDTWAYFALTLPSSPSTDSTVGYINGTRSATSTEAGSVRSINTTSGPVFLGSSAANSAFYKGMMDEVRISNSQRPATWILTEYNNQFSPSTFYSYGALTSETRKDSGNNTAPAIKIKGGVKFK